MHAPPQLDPQQNDTHNITTSTHNSEAATNEISQHHDKAVTVSAKLKTSKQTMNMRRKLKSTKIFPCSQCIKTFPQKYRSYFHCYNWLRLHRTVVIFSSTTNLVEEPISLRFHHPVSPT